MRGGIGRVPALVRAAPSATGHLGGRDQHLVVGEGHGDAPLAIVYQVLQPDGGLRSDGFLVHGGWTRSGCTLLPFHPSPRYYPTSPATASATRSPSIAALTIPPA